MVKVILWLDSLSTGGWVVFIFAWLAAVALATWAIARAARLQRAAQADRRARERRIFAALMRVGPSDVDQDENGTWFVRRGADPEILGSDPGIALPLPRQRPFRCPECGAFEFLRTPEPCPNCGQTMLEIEPADPTPGPAAHNALDGWDPAPTDPRPELPPHVLCPTYYLRYGPKGKPQ